MADQRKISRGRWEVPHGSWAPDRTDRSGCANANRRESARDVHGACAAPALQWEGPVCLRAALVSKLPVV